jgi:hypothetical protein
MEALYLLLLGPQASAHQHQDLVGQIHVVGVQPRHDHADLDPVVAFNPQSRILHGSEAT